MTIDEMLDRKREFGYTYEDLSELSGVPISTVQKVLGRTTKAPRRSTIEALSRAFAKLEDRKCKIEVDNDPYLCFVCEDSGENDMIRGSNAYNLSSNINKTLDDYLALPDDVRVELIDGVFYDMAGPNNIHQIINGEIHNIFKNYIRANKGRCMPMMAPADVQLDGDDKTIVEPDVFVVCDRNKMTKPRTVGAPDLVIEVLSPSNWYHDTVRKLKKYRNAGVREYWIVMPDSKKVLVYFFEKSVDPIEYTFDDIVPVNIWNGDCVVDFREVYDIYSFLI
ncbi:MAG: Uma2 family endonuclease [Lachnospiraceae bacterium]|nr:Uma2 family endonuclease [Lachnospiraceae bacterium]